MASEYSDYSRRKNLYDAVAKGYVTDSSQFEGGVSSSTDSESIFPGSSVQYKKPDKATGATGAAPQPPKPAPTQPNNPFLSNPVLQNALNQHFNTSGNTWYDRAANQANAATEQFGADSPTLVNYHWAAGTGGIMGGNNSVIEKTYSDGSRTVGPGGSQYNMFGDSAPPTTFEKQKELWGAAVNANTNAVGGVSPTAGILPPWNSPTGNAIDTRTMTETPFTYEPTPPTGWLKNAIAAARSGASTYDTGGLKSEGNSPQGGISVANGRDYAATPSGGTIGLNTSTNNSDSPFIGDRANLLNAINKSQTPTNPDTGWESGRTGQEWTKRKPIGEVIY